MQCRHISKDLPLEARRGVANRIVLMEWPCCRVQGHCWRLCCIGVRLPNPNWFLLFFFFFFCLEGWAVQETLRGFAHCQGKTKEITHTRILCTKWFLFFVFFLHGLTNPKGGSYSPSVLKPSVLVTTVYIFLGNDETVCRNSFTFTSKDVVQLKPTVWCFTFLLVLEKLQNDEVMCSWGACFTWQYSHIGCP